MSIIFQPMAEAGAQTLVSWRYEAPYDIYNLDSPDEQNICYFLEPQNAFYSITGQSGNMAAFCSFGPDGQVLGGDYRANALDIGMGLRPNLTGQGQGLMYVKAVLDFARRAFAPAAFRVTVAQFNKRALRVWEKAGFRAIQTFQSKHDGQTFVVLLREE